MVVFNLIGKIDNDEIWNYNGKIRGFSKWGWLDQEMQVIDDDYDQNYLTELRAEAFAKIPKRVELTIKNDTKTNYIDESRTSQKIYGELQKLKVNGIVKVVIEEVASSQEARQE